MEHPIKALILFSLLVLLPVFGQSQTPHNPAVDEVVARCQNAQVESWSMGWDEHQSHILRECASIMTLPQCRDGFMAMADNPSYGIAVMGICREEYCPIMTPQPAYCAMDESTVRSDPAQYEAFMRGQAEFMDLVRQWEIGPTMSSTPPRNSGAAAAVERCQQAYQGLLEFTFDHDEVMIRYDETLLTRPIAACADMVVEDGCRTPWSTIADDASVDDAVRAVLEPCRQAYCPLFEEPLPTLCSAPVPEDSDGSGWLELQNRIFAHDNGVAMMNQVQLAIGELLYQTRSVQNLDLVRLHATLSPDLFIPYSSADSPVPFDTLTIALTEHEILVNTEFAAPLQNGTLPAIYRVSETSPLIPALQTAIEQALAEPEDLRIMAFSQGDPEAIFAAHRDTSYEILTATMMTASVAGVGQFSLAVLHLPRAELFERPEYPPNLPASILRIHSPRWSDNEEVLVPRLLVAISDQGTLALSDMRPSPEFAASGLQEPVDGCSAPSTVCVPPDRASAERLMERVDFRQLYNRLVEIYHYPAWVDGWDTNNRMIYIVADRSVPVDVVVRTMDVARCFLEQDSYPDETSFRGASCRDGSVDGMFNLPVLLLPRVSE